MPNEISSANQTPRGNSLPVPDPVRSERGTLNALRAAFTLAINQTFNTLTAATTTLFTPVGSDPQAGTALSALPAQPPDPERLGFTIAASTTPLSCIQPPDITTFEDLRTAKPSALESGFVYPGKTLQAADASVQSDQDAVDHTSHAVETCIPAGTVVEGGVAGLTFDIWRHIADSMAPRDTHKPGGIIEALNTLQALACSSKLLAAAVRSATFNSPILRSVINALNQLAQVPAADNDTEKWAAYHGIRKPADSLVEVMTFLSLENQKRVATSTTLYAFSPAMLASMNDTEREALVVNVIAGGNKSGVDDLIKLCDVLAYLN
jgi:hypothetical protein